MSVDQFVFTVLAAVLVIAAVCLAVAVVADVAS